MSLDFLDRGFLCKPRRIIEESKNFLINILKIKFYIRSSVISTW